MSNIQTAYDQWAGQYDTNQNKTRDLEALALRELLAPLRFGSVLEVGCGTGKNTAWYATRADRILAVDLSEEMLAKAREKKLGEQVTFRQADITREWPAEANDFDLAGFSLVLEHIPHLDPVIRQCAGSLRTGGYLYIGELHPFKQYQGSKARFETEEGLQVVDCFNHHVSDFTGAAEKAGLRLIRLEEYFDEGNRTGIPRILALLFEKG